MDVGLVTAFIGGVLAILSPCGALLLPAFFASTAGSGPRLLLHGFVFYIGLLTLLVPLGLGLGAIGQLFHAHYTLIIAIASIVMIVFGIAQIFGFGFDASKVLPGSDKIETAAATSAGLLKSLLLGMASGVAGFCAGPILGAVLTLAMTQGSVGAAGFLLAIYALGMVLPLVAIAAAWNRMTPKGRAALRGKTFRFLGREFHTTSVIGGLIIVAAGVLLWVTNGFMSMPELIPSSVTTWLQTKAAAIPSTWVATVAVVAVAGLALLAWYKKTRASRSHVDPDADFGVDSGEPGMENAGSEEAGVSTDVFKVAQGISLGPSNKRED